jgi:uncharacterized RDD family membrane protein YckC
MSKLAGSDAVNSDNPYQTPKSHIDVPQTPVGDLELATRWQRFLGAFVDGLIMSAIAFPLLFGVAAISGNAFGSSLVDQVIAGVILFGIWLAINYQLLNNGQTVGKKVVGTQIVRTNGDRTTAGHIITRRLLPIHIVSYIPVVGGLISLVDTLCIFRQTRKCLHDDIADTIVIKLNPARSTN